MKKILFLLAIFMVGCNPSHLVNGPKKLLIEKVFIEGDYSFKFVVRDPQTENLDIRSYQKPWRVGRGTFVLKDDVPEGGQCWAKVEEWEGDGSVDLVLELHIRNVSDLQGGEINRGKAGKIQLHPLTP